MSRVHLMKLAAGLLVAAIVSTTTPPAQAQPERGVELTVFNGYYIASDLYTSVGAVSGAQLGLENSYMYGGRVGFNPNPRLGLEFAYTHTGSDLKIEGSVPGFVPGGDLGRINFNTYGVDFLFMQPTPNQRATGFFTLGFGWSVTDPEIPSLVGQTIDSETLFNWNFGLGTKIEMNEKLMLRLEGRWRVTDTSITTSSGVYCDYWGYCYSYASDWYNSGELTAGLTYKLGSR